MLFQGKIYDIVEISNGAAQISFKKKDGDKYVIWHVHVFGYWKDKALITQKLKPKMKIKANLHQDSKKKPYNGKDLWRGDLFFKEIHISEQAPIILSTRHKGLFDGDTMIINPGTNEGRFDKETGEILE